jgi:hypothetical protein
MNWWQKHADTIVVMTAVLSCFGWMNSSIHNLENNMSSRFSELEKDIVMIKTVLIMRNIMPNELAHVPIEKEG